MTTSVARATNASPTAPIAFLFRASGPGIPDYYGEPCNEALLAGLSAVDPAGTTTSLILRGDLLLHNLATKTLAVERDERSSMARQGYDSDLLATLIHDFIIDSEAGWHTFEPGILLKSFGRTAIHCMVLPTLPLEFRAGLDAAFRSVPFYLGAMEIDLGNPIQVAGFFTMLVRDAAVHDGALYLERDWAGDVHAPFEGAETFKPNGLRVVDAGELMTVAGPLPSADLSTRGAVTLARYEGKRSFTLQERVLKALWHSGSDQRDQAFAFTADQDMHAVFDAVVPLPKFVAFLLNPDHKDNKGRAKFFADVLGIGSDDWRYLAAQIQEGLDEADPGDLGIKQWEDGSGVSFNLPITIRGLNGRSATVLSNWIMRPGEQPSLSTIVPGRERATAEGRAPSVLPSQLQGKERWAALYSEARAAGEAAAASAVPTPMYISDFGPVAEGLCGWATVNVPDARRDFARWLIREGHASRGYRGGATILISDDTQSVDRAFAHAKAFARVLQHNGVACSIDRLLD